MSAMAELAADNDRFSIGANGPPEPIPVSPFDAIKVHIDDLLVEARNWADGTVIETQAQADDLSRLIEDLRLAISAADEARIAEKAPYDLKVAEIQERYNALIADNKTLKGTAVVATATLKATLKVFLDAEEAKRAAAAEVARAAARKAEEDALSALRAAGPTNLEAREEAEVLVVAARQANTAAARTENARPQARGGSRAMGLRKTYTAEVTDPRALLLHYWGTKDVPGVNRDPLLACLKQMAQQDVDWKVHTIPGVAVIEGTRL